MSAQSNDKGVCKFSEPPPAPMVGQASSPDIMITSGDACPTNEGGQGEGMSPAGGGAGGGNIPRPQREGLEPAPYLIRREGGELIQFNGKLRLRCTSCHTNIGGEKHFVSHRGNSPPETKGK